MCCYWFDCYCVCCRFAGGCLSVLLTLYSLPGLSFWGWVVLEAFLGCFVVCLCVLLVVGVGVYLRCLLALVLDLLLAHVGCSMVGIYGGLR